MVADGGCLPAFNFELFLLTKKVRDADGVYQKKKKNPTFWRDSESSKALFPFNFVLWILYFLS